MGKKQKIKANKGWTNNDTFMLALGLSGVIIAGYFAMTSTIFVDKQLLTATSPTAGAFRLLENSGYPESYIIHAANSPQGRFTNMHNRVFGVLLSRNMPEQAALEQSLSSGYYKMRINAFNLLHKAAQDIKAMNPSLAQSLWNDASALVSVLTSLVYDSSKPANTLSL